MIYVIYVRALSLLNAHALRLAGLRLLAKSSYGCLLRWFDALSSLALVVADTTSRSPIALGLHVHGLGMGHAAPLHTRDAWVP